MRNRHSNKKVLPVRSVKGCGLDSTSRRAEQSKRPSKTGSVDSAFSSPVTRELVMFHESRCWMTAQMNELKALPQTPEVRRRLRELRVRAQQLYRDVIRWMERYGDIV